MRRLKLAVGWRTGIFVRHGYGCIRTGRIIACSVTWVMTPWLVNPRAPTVDEKEQDDNEEYSRYDPNDCDVIHDESSFRLEVFFERLRHDDERRTQSYEEQRRENA